MTYTAILKYARKAVADEYANPYHGRLTGYDNQSVLVDVLNAFPALSSDSEDDEETIRTAVREAEGEFNEKYGVSL